MDSILRAVADRFQMQPAQLKQKTNAQNIAYPRQIAMYLIKELTHCSLPEIGRMFGGKHHTNGSAFSAENRQAAPEECRFEQADPQRNRFDTLSLIKFSTVCVFVNCEPLWNIQASLIHAPERTPKPTTSDDFNPTILL